MKRYALATIIVCAVALSGCPGMTLSTGGNQYPVLNVGSFYRFRTTEKDHAKVVSQTGAFVLVTQDGITSWVNIDQLAQIDELAQ